MVTVRAQWTEKLYPPSRGQDHLGLGSVSSDQILPKLSPGIVVQTVHPRYWSFYRSFWTSSGAGICRGPGGTSRASTAHERRSLPSGLTCATGQSIPAMAQCKRSSARSRREPCPSAASCLRRAIRLHQGGARRLRPLLQRVHRGHGPDAARPARCGSAFRRPDTRRPHPRERLPGCDRRHHLLPGVLRQRRRASPGRSSPGIHTGSLPVPAPEQTMLRTGHCCETSFSTQAVRRTPLNAGQRCAFSSTSHDQTAGHALTEDRFRQLVYYQADTDGAAWTPLDPNVRTARRWRLYQAREYYSFALEPPVALPSRVGAGSHSRRAATPFRSQTGGRMSIKPSTSPHWAASSESALPDSIAPRQSRSWPAGQQQPPVLVAISTPPGMWAPLSPNTPCTDGHPAATSPPSSQPP